MLGFSQGIEFEHGTWSEVQKKAQQNNKPIFVDVFTTWCGPCKMMSKEIFPLEEVGKVFNANYVCFKIDAEKGEGIDFAKHYEVTAYPTYLFIKPDGTLFYRALGSMDAKKFIAESEKAMEEMNDPKPLNMWDKEYPDKKNDATFLLNYMEKRSKLGLENTKLFDEYLTLLPENERVSSQIEALYEKEYEKIIVTSLAFQNIQKNREAFEKILGDKKANIHTILMVGIENSVRKAARAKDEQLLNKAIEVFDQLPIEARKMSKEELFMIYYQRVGNMDKYNMYATSYAENNLMKVTDSEIAEKDRINLQSIEDRIKSGKIDTTKVDAATVKRIKDYWANKERNTICEKLNNFAWTFFENESDKAKLQKALAWSKRSLDLSPNSWMYRDTYANLLYKLGKKQDAIAQEENALKQVGTDNENDSKGLKETLEKMKAGEKTWKK